MSPQAQKTFQQAGNVVLVAILTVLFAIFFLVWQEVRQGPEPLTFDRVRLEADHVKPGESLHLNVVFRRTKACPTHTLREISTAPENVIVWRENVRTDTPVTDGKPVRVSVLIRPPALPPGRYAYRGFPHTDCGGRQTFVARQPTVIFEVVE